MDKLFLLDAYALIYRAYYAFIKNPRINSKGMNTSAVMGFVNTLNEILTKEHPTHIGVAFDHGKTFRDEAFPAYKAQREETPEDIRASVPVIKDIITAMNIPVLQAASRRTTSSARSPQRLAPPASRPTCSHLTRTTVSWYATMSSSSVRVTEEDMRRWDRRR